MVLSRKMVSWSGPADREVVSGPAFVAIIYRHGRTPCLRSPAFSGSVIRMYAEAGGAHHRPHFHAYYHECGGVYALDKVELIAG